MSDQNNKNNKNKGNNRKHRNKDFDCCKRNRRQSGANINDFDLNLVSPELEASGDYFFEDNQGNPVTLDNDQFLDFVFIYACGNFSENTFLSLFLDIPDLGQKIIFESDIDLNLLSTTSGFWIVNRGQFSSILSAGVRIGFTLNQDVDDPNAQICATAKIQQLQLS